MPSPSSKITNIFAGALAPIAFFFALGAIIFFLSINTAPGPNESRIVQAVVDHMHGASFPTDKYPSFFFSFYGFFLWLFSLLHVDAEPIQCARIINSALYLFNVCMFYYLAKGLLGRFWAAFGAFIFAFMPMVFFSGWIIRTESLVLAQILAVLFLAKRMEKRPESILPHVFAGLICGAAIATKYNFIPVLTYFFAASFPDGRDHEKGLLAQAFKAFFSRRTLSFCLVFAAAAAASWENLWSMLESGGNFRNLAYFTDAPSVHRAVPEWDAFPFGRYSHAFCVMIPFALGIVNYAAGIAGIGLRLVPKRRLILWGAPPMVYLLVVLSISLLRPPNLFTPFGPFLAFAAAAFFRGAIQGKNPWLKGVAVAGVSIAIVFSFAQVRLVRDMMGSVKRVSQDAAALMKMDDRPDPKLVWLTISTTSASFGLDPANIDVSIKKMAPDYIIALDSYLNNFCKYQRNQPYARQCEYFRSLLNGDEGYEVIMKRSHSSIIASLLSFDPEIKGAYYVLRKKLNSTY